MNGLDDDTLYNSKKYNFKCFSVFDHRLTNEEAEGQVFFYEHALKVVNTPQSKQYFKYHDQFIKFYINLYNLTPVYRVFISEYGPSPIVKFNDIEEYKSHLLLGVREQFFAKFVLPEFYTVLTTNYDLMHTLKSKPEGFQKISKIIKDNGLFILD